ncbi:MAG: glycoside hydrolase family 31 protein [Actinomycetota bacterium]
MGATGDEVWWGGRVADGAQMPFSTVEPVDLTDHASNQAAGLLLSNRGRVIWADEPFSFSIIDGRVEVVDDARREHVGSNLRDATRWAAEHVYHRPRRLPAARLFDPQWCGWIEQRYEPTQERILGYAEQIVEHGYPPGVLMIDDNWSEDYGAWRFRSDRFPDPAAMVAELERLGFAVMLWVCPYVSPDGIDYLRLRDAGLLVSDRSGEPVIRRWWNGYSAVLDLTNEAARSWFRAQLSTLQDDYGIAGFKFDGADPDMYAETDVTSVSLSPSGHVQRYGTFAEEFAYNELRTGWNLGGRGLAMRLSDADHSWGPTGIAKLVPDHLAQGLLGMPCGAPDMIGGGQYLDFDEDRLDPEIFVRHAQVAALCPMMQFSAAPWRVLDDDHARLVRSAVSLRAAHQDRIVALAQRWVETGDPIMRPIAYEFPNAGLDDVNDCFLLGPDLLVAPVVVPGATTREVPLPPGRWIDELGNEHDGGSTITVDVTLESLPRFELDDST